jgi:hypothetical protein
MLRAVCYVLNREETKGAHHVGLVSEAREVAMVARSRDVSLDEATEIIETYARVVAPEALAKRTIKVYDEILAKLASGAPFPTNRFSFNVTTTVFCVVQGTFTASTLSVWGGLRAR